MYGVQYMLHGNVRRELNTTSGLLCEPHQALCVDVFSHLIGELGLTPVWFSGVSCSYFAVAQ